MNKTLRKTMISTIAMLVVAIMSLTGVTYAWFTQAEFATVEGMSMTVEAAEGGLQISTDSNSGFKNAVTINSDMTGIKPVSTVNGDNFFTVEFNPANGDEFKTIATDKTNVWSQILYVKNTGYSAITVDLEGTNFEDTNEDDTRDASKAAKLAVFVYTTVPAEEEGGQATETKTLAFIFSPSDDYKGVKAASDNYFTISGDTTYLGNVTNIQQKAVDCTFEVGASQVVGDVLQETVVKIEVVVWVEGQDADCVNQNANSGFNVNLQFNATAKAA